MHRLVCIVAGLAAEIVLIQSLRRLHGGRVDGCLVCLTHHAGSMQQLCCLIQPFGRLAAVGHAHAGSHFVAVLIKRDTGLRIVLITELAPQSVVLRVQLCLSVRIAGLVPVHGVLEKLRQRRVAVSCTLLVSGQVLARIASLLCGLLGRKPVHIRNAGTLCTVQQLLRTSQAERILLCALRSLYNRRAPLR